jgi:hypothetical protein
MKIAVMAGFFAKGDMDVNSCRGRGGMVGSADC